MESSKLKLWLCHNCENYNTQTSFTCEVCGEDLPIEERPPVIKILKSSSKTINDVDTITISWKTENSKYVTLNGIRVSANGNKEIPATERIILRASNHNGKTEKEISIKVLHNPVLHSIHLSKNRIELGKKCYLTLGTSNVNKVLFEGKVYSPNEKIIFTPTRTRTYSFTMVGIEGEECDKEFFVEVYSPAPIISIKTPEYAKVGEKVKIVWTTENVAYAKIDGEKFSSIDSYEWIYGIEGVIRSIEFYGPCGELYNRDVRIRKAESPNIRSCEITGHVFNEGEVCHFQWEGEHVLAWGLENEDILYHATKKSLDIWAVKEIFKFIFIGEDDSKVKKEIRIKVIHKPIIQSCEITTNKPQKGEPCTIEWKSEYTEKVSINKIDYPASGSYTLKPKKNQDVVLDFYGENGNIITKTLNVVLPPTEIIVFQCDKTNLRKGEEYSINWFSKNVDYVQINENKYNSKYTYRAKAIKSEQIVVSFFGVDGSVIQRLVNIVVAIPDVVINKCTCDKLEVKQGEKVSLTWNSQNVDHVSLSNIEGKFNACTTKSFVVNNDTKVVVIFWGENGKQTTRSFNIKSIPPIIIHDLCVDKNVKKGKKCLITWAVDNVDRIYVNGLEYTGQSKCEYIPEQSGTVKFDFYGIDGSMTSRTVQVNVIDHYHGINILSIILVIIIILLIIAYLVIDYYSPKTIHSILIKIIKHFSVDF